MREMITAKDRFAYSEAEVSRMHKMVDLSGMNRSNKINHLQDAEAKQWKENSLEGKHHSSDFADKK